MPITEILFAGGEGLSSQGAAGPNGAGHYSLGARYVLSGGVLIQDGVTPATEPFTLTAGTVDTDVFGYLNQNPFITGDVSPLLLVSETIAGLYSDNGAFPGTAGLHLIFFGTLAQSLFTSITVNGTTLLSSTATFSLNTGPVAMPNSEWYWGASNPIPGTGSYAGSFTP